MFALPKHLKVTVFIRSVCEFVGVTSYFTSLEYTSLSKASVNYNTFPIFTAIYARIFLHESMHTLDWVAILLACSGMVLMAHESNSGEELDQKLDRIGQILAIFGAITVSFSYMLMRRIAGRMYLMLPPFYLSLMSNVLATPFALWFYST